MHAFSVLQKKKDGRLLTQYIVYTEEFYVAADTRNCRDYSNMFIYVPIQTELVMFALLHIYERKLGICIIAEHLHLTLINLGRVGVGGA